MYVVAKIVMHFYPEYTKYITGQKLLNVFIGRDVDHLWWESRKALPCGKASQQLVDRPENINPAQYENRGCRDFNRKIYN